MSFAAWLYMMLTFGNKKLGFYSDKVVDSVLKTRKVTSHKA